MSNSGFRASLTNDFERFKRALPRDFPAHVRDTYRINLAARYLGEPIPHPVGKGSGQLSLNTGQLETDAEAGLAFAVLKTVIAQDSAGDQSMAAWAIHETKMKVERRGGGWTVTWKGRGWDRSFDEYLALARAAWDFTRAGLLLTVRSDAALAGEGLLADARRRSPCRRETADPAMAARSAREDQSARQCSARHEADECAVRR